MSKIEFLRQKIEEMRQTEVEREGETLTIGELAREGAKSIEVENAAVAIVTTVLAMRQKWRETAKPRVEDFKMKYSDIRTLRDLELLMESMSEREFCKSVLGLRIAETPFPRYARLREFVEAFLTYQEETGIEDDWEAMKDWARNVDVNNVKNDIVGKIKGVNLATVQNLRLLCGIDTVKPDVHVKNVLKEIGLGNEVGVVELLSELTGYSSLELDQIFWHWDTHRSGREEISLEEFYKLPK